MGCDTNDSNCVSLCLRDITDCQHGNSNLIRYAGFITNDFLQIAHAKWIALMVVTIVPTLFVNAR